MKTLKYKEIDYLLFYVISYCFISYVYRLPILDQIENLFIRISPIKTAFAGALLRISFIIVLLLIIRSKIQPKFNNINTLIMIFLLGLTLSYAYAYLDNKQVFISAINNETIYINPKIFFRYFALFTVLIYTLKDYTRIRLFFKILFFTGIFMIVTTLFFSSFVTEFGSHAYSITSKGVGNYYYISYGQLDRNYFTILISITMFITLFFLTSQKNSTIKKSIFYLIIIACILLLFKGLSLGSFVATIFGLYIFFRKYIHLNRIIHITIILFLFIIVILIIVPQYFVDLFITRIEIVFESFLPMFRGESLTDVAFADRSTATKRIGLAIDAIKYFPDSPILGYGGLKDTYSSILGTGSHTDYVNWLTQFGLFTTLPFLILQAIIFKKLNEYRNVFYNKNIKHYYTLSLALTLQSVFLVNSLVAPNFLVLFAFNGLLIAIIKYYSSYLDKFS